MHFCAIETIFVLKQMDLDRLLSKIFDKENEINLWDKSDSHATISLQLHVLTQQRNISKK